MNINWLMRSVLCALICTIAFTGCKTRSAKKGGGLGGDYINPQADGGIYGEVLPGRLDDSTEIRDSQFTAVNFDYDSSQITASERPKLDVVAEYMRSRPSAGLVAEGHSDERGSREYNLALGERRALAVRAYLIGLGIDGANIQTKSMGEEDPVVEGHDEQSWRENRRVEFLLAY
jgi:peptidoglycan-associated lipoprotein